MDRITESDGEPLGFERPLPVDRSIAHLRALVGAAGSSRARADTPRVAELRSLVGEGGATPADGGSRRGLSTAGGGSVPPSRTRAADLAALVGPAVPRTDDHGWMAPELARRARRPRWGGRGSGGAVGERVAPSDALLRFLAVFRCIGWLHEITLNECIP